jgi:hypothetical protein
VRFYKEPLEWLPFSATDLLKPEPNSILQPLRALLQQKKILRTACSARWWRIGSDNPDSHAVQAALVIGDARPHAPDRLLGSLDLILAEHDDRASSTPGRAVPHPGLHYWI